MRATMRWSCGVLVACLAVALTGCRSTGVSSELQPITRALVAADGRSITVPAVGGGCVTRVALTASQTASVVRLRLTAFSVTGHGVACATNVRLLQAATRLRTPLGRRQLVDGDTGREIRYIPGSELAHPMWLPQGTSRPQNSPINGWTRTYSYPATLHRAPLTIVENPKRFPNPSEFHADRVNKLTHLSIHGHPALLLVEDQGRGTDQVELGWHEGGYALIVASIPVSSGQRPLSPAAVTRIADHLTYPGGAGREDTPRQPAAKPSVGTVRSDSEADRAS